MDIKECLQGNATFIGYRKGNLIYKCTNGFIFTIPTSDTGDATFSATERAMLLMRWIRVAVAEAEKQGGELKGSAMNNYTVIIKITDDTPLKVADRIGREEKLNSMSNLIQVTQIFTDSPGQDAHGNAMEGRDIESVLVLLFQPRSGL